MRSSGSKRRLPNWAIGLVSIVVIAIGSVLAYTKQLPWADPYEVQAVFKSAQNLRPSSPVRIAGVEVGEVTEVRHLTSDDPQVTAQATGESGTLPNDPYSGEQAAVVTMSISEEGLPLHEDAQFQLRPRLFLEGNLFVDTKPGSPNAPEVDENHTFSIDQTSNSVQLDQVLTTLQSDVRTDLQTFLDQFGNALVKYGGAKGFQELYRSAAGSFKHTSIVNEALQGRRPHDLSGLIRNLDRVVAALGSNELALQNLITNFRVVSGSFAAESASLEQAIAKLPDVLDAAEPAFANLNAAFPSMRAFAREALPGVRSSAPALRAATPLIEQIRLLVSERELGGLVDDLRPTIPALAKLSARTKKLLPQFRKLSSCFNEVIIPWSNDTVDPPDPPLYEHQPTGTVLEETASGLVGIASESRSGDANGQYIRVEAGGGTNTILTPNGAPDDATDDAVSLLDFPLKGALPSVHGTFADSAVPQFVTGTPCETQEPPDLAAGGIFAGGGVIPPEGGQDNPIDIDEIVQDLEDLISMLPPRAVNQLRTQATAVRKAQEAGKAQAAARESARYQEIYESVIEQAGKTDAFRQATAELGG